MFGWQTILLAFQFVASRLTPDRNHCCSLTPHICTWFAYHSPVQRVSELFTLCTDQATVFLEVTLCCLVVYADVSDERVIYIFMVVLSRRWTQWVTLQRRWTSTRLLAYYNGNCLQVTPHLAFCNFAFVFLLLYPLIYRVIHKSLRDFRTRLRNNQDRHGRKEHINR